MAGARRDRIRFRGIFPRARVNIPHHGRIGRGYLVATMPRGSPTMRRAITLFSSARAGKWLACALVVLVPGSFVILPLAWIVRQCLAARG
jgi:hypothetical protein